MFREGDEHTVADGSTEHSYRPRTLSQVLTALAADASGPVTVERMRAALADRSLATFLVLTCLLNLLPFPPPSTLVLGIPIIVVALQMMAGRKLVWLPKFFLRQSLNEKSFSKLTGNLVPLIVRLEKVIRPRYWPFPSAKLAERVVGTIALVLGLFVFIPLPFTNWIPAFAGVICGIALSERDGIWLGIGTLIGAISVIGIGSAYVFGAMAFTGWLGG